MYFVHYSDYYYTPTNFAEECKYIELWCHVLGLAEVTVSLKDRPLDI